MKSALGLMTLVSSALLSATGFAGEIWCDHGFYFNTSNGFISMNMDSNTSVFEGYLYRSRAGYYVDGLNWDSFRNTYFASSYGGPTVQVSQFDSGATLLLSATRSGSRQDFWFHGCSE